MKKILVYLEKSKLAPHGGPYAVGYYIYKRVQNLGISNISFIEDSKPIKYRGGNPKWLSFFRPLLKIRAIVNRIKRYKLLFSSGQESLVNFNEFDIIHFHTTRSMYEVRHSLANFDGKVVLTSHSPVPLAKELYDEQLSTFEKIFFKKLYKKLPLMDEFAFNRADVIQFPCPESEEPYIKYLNGYRSFREKNHFKYRYIATGIPASRPRRNKNDIREHLGIQLSDFIVSYVGRHNLVKGYDKLKQMGNNILCKYNNVYFTIAGKESPLKGVKNPHWIEIGWTSDALSYVAASDVFVLPNEETYFDIVMLEVLSIGQLVVASRTGGNKYFEQFKNSGIFLYDTVDEAIQCIENIRTMTEEDKNKLRNINKQIFMDNFTDEIFFSNYLQMLQQI